MVAFLSLRCLIVNPLKPCSSKITLISIQLYTNGILGVMQSMATSHNGITFYEYDGRLLQLTHDLHFIIGKWYVSYKITIQIITYNNKQENVLLYLQTHVIFKEKITGW